MSEPMKSRPIEWKDVRRVLVVRLRSIGDTVLSTPVLISLKKFLPEARVDILLEDWVAPVLDGFEYADDVVIAGKSAAEKATTALELRRRGYDVVINLHGGTTSTFFTRAAGARYRIGYAEYRYASLYTHLLSSSADFWQKPATHSAEQQLALIGFVGVPVDPKQRTHLAVTDAAEASLREKFRATTGGDLDARPYALLHPAAAFDTKQWAAERFARVAEHLEGRGLMPVAVAAAKETAVLDRLADAAACPIISFSELSLPEITALASRAAVFVGNDSGIAHIAGAVETATVVIFGSSNRAHWHPWTDAPNEIVFQEFACQPCPGYECKEFGEPRCILSVTPESVIAAVDRVLA
ncbi:MAG: glycosyltransferase family 9 protein [Pyrinomonadaceae bacterium]|nr:glycosyltransferase family 9 protein [Pyrinomonadaceae bacterium]